MLDFRRKKIAALTTDDVPQGTENIYLSETGGLTDNLVGMPNFELVSTTLNDHLANIDNPHSQILSGLRTHQTQVTLTQDIVIDRDNYIDCLLVNDSDSNDYTITIPDESSLSYQFATHAAFVAFRLGSANLSVIAAPGVQFVNALGSIVTLPTPQASYYLFIKQGQLGQNKWAVVTFNGGGGGGCCITKINVTAATYQMQPNSQYLANNPGGVTFTLPPDGASQINDEIIVIGNSPWSIQPNVGQAINVGTVSTLGGAGTNIISSNNNYDCIKLVCSAVSPARFTAMVDQGNVLVS